MLHEIIIAYPGSVVLITPDKVPGKVGSNPVV